MLERFKTILTVTIVTVTVWLFAEAESLSSYSSVSRIQFVAGEGTNRIVRVAEGFGASVTVDVEGSRAALEKAREILTSGVRLELGKPGVPLQDGTHSVNLLEAIQAYQPLTQAGVQVVSVTPQNITIRVLELETRQVPVDPQLPGVQVVGSVKVTPETAPIRLPRSEWLSMTQPLRLVARLPEDQTRELPASGVARREVRVTPPATTSGVEPFPNGVPTVELEFTVKNRNAIANISAAPVQVILPPIESGKWKVEIDPQDQFLALEVSGPSEVIERLQAAGSPVIAIVALSSDELEKGVESKEVAFGQLRAGVLAALPDSVRVTAPKTSVRLKVARIVP